MNHLDSCTRQPATPSVAAGQEVTTSPWRWLQSNANIPKCLPLEGVRTPARWTPTPRLSRPPTAGGLTRPLPGVSQPPSMPLPAPACSCAYGFTTPRWQEVRTPRVLQMLPLVRPLVTGRNVEARPSLINSGSFTHFQLVPKTRDKDHPKTSNL